MSVAPSDSPGGAGACSREGTLCPLCGGPNACQMCTDATYKGNCWCFHVEMPDALLKRVRAEDRGRVCICHRCVAEARRAERWVPRARAGEFYFTDDGRFVFTAAYHLRRGYCCGSGCRHCPFDAEGSPRPECLVPAEPGSKTTERTTV